MRKGKMTVLPGMLAFLLTWALGTVFPVFAGYVDHGDGTVTDTVTRLMWQRADDGVYRTWAAALAYCESRTIGGHTDWRLPNIRELESLVDLSRHDPAIDPVFSCRSDAYWSGSTNAATRAFAWVVGFNVGGVLNYYEANELFVRCVREGPSGSFGPLTIAQAPMSGPPGTTFIQWGTGFTPSSTAVLHFRKPDGTELPTQLQSIDSSGHFELSYLAPWNKPAGTYTWWAVDATGAVSNAVSYDITAQAGALEQFVFQVNGEAIPAQQVNGPFEVNVTARDGYGTVLTGFTGTVTLSDSTGTVSPIAVTLRNGAWQGPLTILLPHAANRLKAGYDGIVSYSNAFSVDGSCSRKISGVVVDNDHRPLNNARVILKLSESPSIRTEVTSDANGRFSFGLQPCSDYEAYANWNGHYSDVRGITNPNSAAAFVLRVSYPEAAPGKTPVLLVPGFMGSTLAIASEMKIWPALMPRETGDLRERLALHDPFKAGPLAVGWREIQSLLDSNGYKVFPVPWDWRMSIDPTRSQNAVHRYLIPAIDKAKKAAGTDKVHIVAHSLGGLLARSYIQSDVYGNRSDVDKLVMIGTPQRGGSDSYYMWEGGRIEDTFPWVRLGTVRNLYWMKHKLSDWGFLGAEKKVEFLHKEIPSLLEAGMPPPDKAYLRLCRDCRDRATTEVRNTFLEDLNADRTLLTQRVAARVFYGTGTQTRDWIHVGSSDGSKKVYPDGVPIDEVLVFLGRNPYGEKDGDGTVSVESAVPPGWGWESISSPVSRGHAFLPGACATEVVSFITSGESSSMESLSHKDAESADEETASSFLSIDLSPGVEPLVTDSQARRAGIDLATGDVLREIPGAEIAVDQNGGGVAIESPVAGSYTVKLKGGMERDFVVKITYTDLNGKATQVERRGAAGTDVFQFTIAFNPNSPSPLVVTAQAGTPTGVFLTFNTSGKPVLSWSSVSTPSISGYNIYRRQSGQPFPVRLGTYPTTAATSYTDSTAVSGEVYSYSVCAVTSTGARGFLSEERRTDDRDSDGLSDSEEAQLGTDPGKADTDGDGIADGMETVVRTNPLLKDTDADGFSDYQELVEGSDPLDPTSRPRAKSMPWLQLLLDSP